MVQYCQYSQYNERLNQGRRDRRFPFRKVQQGRKSSKGLRKLAVEILVLRLMRIKLLAGSTSKWAICQGIAWAAEVACAHPTYGLLPFDRNRTHPINVFCPLHGVKLRSRCGELCTWRTPQIDRSRLSQLDKSKGSTDWICRRELPAKHNFANESFNRKTK